MNTAKDDFFLIGFDAREDWLSFDVVWDASHKEQYLLTPNVTKPLSVDANVWLTILNEAGTVHPSAFDPDLRGFERVEVPNDLEGNSPLFRSSEQLKSTVRRDWCVALKAVSIVAISAVRDRSSGKSNSWPREGVVSESADVDWEFLGYDVADAGLVSGLLNCGYTPDDKRTARQRWTQTLNRNHLFRDFAAAMSFKTWTDQRVREHAPFSVYGLHVVSRVGETEPGQSALSH